MPMTTWMPMTTCRASPGQLFAGPATACTVGPGNFPTVAAIPWLTAAAPAGSERAHVATMYCTPALASAYRTDAVHSPSAVHRATARHGPTPATSSSVAAATSRFASVIRSAAASAADTAAS